MAEEHGLLETRNVFLDTQAWKSHQLDFSNNRVLNKFRELCENDELNSFTTAVVVSEVNKKICEKIEKAVREHQQLVESVTTLSDSGLPDFNMQNYGIDEKAIIERENQAFEHFLEDSKTEILNVDAVSVNEVFKLYFQQLPPFGPKGKQKEFPDAFTVLALEAKLRGEKLYVVSDDGDLKTYCDQNPDFILVKKLSSILDVYNTHESQLVEKIKEAIPQLKEQIEEELISTLDSVGVFTLGGVGDAEVTEFQVISSEVTQFNVIDYDDNSASIEITIKGNYVADVSADDPSMSYYDREDDKMHVFGQIEREFEGSFSETGVAELEFTIEKNKIDVQDVSVMFYGLKHGLDLGLGDELY